MGLPLAQKLVKRLTSGGAAYTLDVGFVPEKITVHNKTKWATDATVVKSYYHRGDTQGYAYNEITDDSGVNRSISTSNGFTVVETTSIASNQATVSGATQADPVVITTSAAHGFTTGDSVRFGDVGGMTELNRTNKPFKITVLTTTTFSLDDTDGTGFTAYTSGGTVYNITADVQNVGYARVTLGTDVVGADSDVLVVELEGLDYTNLGDIG